MCLHRRRQQSSVRGGTKSNNNNNNNFSKINNRAIKTNKNSDRAHLALSKTCNIIQNFMIFLRFFISRKLTFHSYYNDYNDYNESIILDQENFYTL